jgi:hypothetical protein
MHWACELPSCGNLFVCPTQNESTEGQLTLCRHAGAIMAVLWWGARLVIDDRLSVGQLSSFVVYSIFVSGNVGQLAGVFTSLMQVSSLWLVALTLLLLLLLLLLSYVQHWRHILFSIQGFGFSGLKTLKP